MPRVRNFKKRERNISKRSFLRTEAFLIGCLYLEYLLLLELLLIARKATRFVRSGRETTQRVQKHAKAGRNCILRAQATARILIPQAVLQIVLEGLAAGVLAAAVLLEIGNRSFVLCLNPRCMPPWVFILCFPVKSSSQDWIVWHRMDNARTHKKSPRWRFFTANCFCYFAFGRILNIFVPQTSQVPDIAFRSPPPFPAKLTSLASFITRSFALHLTQYAVSAI